MKLLISLITLLIFSGCSERVVYVKPKALDVRILKDCPDITVAPNKDGSLSRQEHKKLLSVISCINSQRKYYIRELKNIQESQKQITKDIK